MIISLIALIAGFILLMWSANMFVDHALHLDQHFNISKLVIGMVVLGFGTSSPELLVSAISAWQGNPGLAIGNALGSNIANILLVLGVTLCVLPLHIYKRIVQRDFVLLLMATALFVILILDKQLTTIDGAIMLFALVLILYVLSKLEIKEHIRDESMTIATEKSLSNVLSGILVGLIVLLLSSKLVVWGATSIAQLLGVSDLIIGLTIVALGTSLPELATCVSSALKKHSELVLGNVIGSNIFNTLGVTGVAAVITNYLVPREIYFRDFPIMLIATVVLFLLALIFLSKRKIPRSFGVVFTISYFIYMYFIYLQAS